MAESPSSGDSSPLARMISTSSTRRLLEQDIIREYIQESSIDVTNKPFIGAQPKLLKKPEILDAEEVDKRSRIACRMLAQRVETASKVVVVLGEDARCNAAWKDVLYAAKDNPSDESTFVALGTSWLQTLPRLKPVRSPWEQHVDRSLLIYIGTPGKYLHVCTRSTLTQQFDSAFAENRLVVICRGGCMLPVGTQVENIHGTDYMTLVDHVAHLTQKRGSVSWGHGPNSKSELLGLSYSQPAHGPSDISKAAPLLFNVSEDEEGAYFELLTDYVCHLNDLKLQNPQVQVANYYDTGMLVSVCMGTIVNRGVSLLTDRDGLCMLRDASIGHTMSKLNQLLNVWPYRARKGIYNFFIGDGASRLNGGAELVMHLMQNYQEEPLVTVFLFNNEMWAIEDNLISHHIEEHTLRNASFYDLLRAHPQVSMCSSDRELRATLETISKQNNEYLNGSMKPQVRLVIVRGVDVDVPPMLGNIEPILKSSDMAFLCHVLGHFARGCTERIPIYGCSAFEYIQFLDIFLKQKAEGQRYQYVCGRTDIQAAHMAGYRQPDGKCVVMINDVYGINSIGESLRALFSGSGNEQLLLMIWHPTLTKVVDNFHLHRPPMVWPSLGPELCKYYARSTNDIFVFDFQGTPTTKVNDALTKGTPLVVVNMLPEHERNYVGLDIRVKVHETQGAN